jgi:predicted CoA-binding protein
MPDAHTLLESLHAIANTYVPLAVAWHGALAVYLFIALGLGKEPRWRLLGRLLALPVASVSILAWLSGNPFNGTVFGALTVFLLLWAQRLRKDAASPALSLRAARGLSPFMLAYAAAYPHFVNGGLSWLTLLTAPLGVLPCPTISLLVAAGLFSGGFGSRSWSRVVAATGLAYAVLGILVLGVWLDVGLLLGALLLFGISFRLAPAAAPGFDERRAIEEFMALRRIALVGASQEPAHFSRVVLRELTARGIEVIPVHPSAQVIEGRPAFCRLGDITPKVNGALIMTPREAAAEVVRQAADAGIGRVWLHRGAGGGAVSDAAIELARARGLTLVAGHCPLMFVDGQPKSVHRVHAAWMRLLGRYPPQSHVRSHLQPRHDP